MLRLVRRLGRDQAGVTMVEYALIAALVSIVAISLISAMGTRVKNIFTTINNALSTA